MSIQNRTVIEIEKETRKYQLHMNPDSSLGEIFDVLIEMQKVVSNKISEVIVHTASNVQKSGEST